MLKVFFKYLKIDAYPVGILPSYLAGIRCKLLYKWRILTGTNLK